MISLLRYSVLLKQDKIFPESQNRLFYGNSGGHFCIWNRIIDCKQTTWVLVSARVQTIASLMKLAKAPERVSANVDRAPSRCFTFDQVS